MNVVYVTWNPQPNLIQKHLDNWEKIPLEYRKQLRFILVDDCSDEVIHPKVDFPINLDILRITTDKFWNAAGAKNLGFNQADDDWVISSDIDHFIPPEEYVKAVDMEKTKGNIYLFQRYMPDGKYKNKNSRNLLMIHKSDFEKVGYYDEDMVGGYGYDEATTWDTPMNQGHNMSRKAGLKSVWTDLKIVENQKYVTGDLNERRKTQGRNHKLATRKINEIKAGVYKNGPILRFEWKTTMQWRIS